MEKIKGRLPKKEGEYVIETKSGKHIAYYDKTMKRFIWDFGCLIGCSVANAKSTFWWKE